MSALNANLIWMRARAGFPYLIVMAIGIVLYAMADRFEFEQASGRIGPGAWPQLILLLTIATALWGFVSGILKSGRAAPADDIVHEHDEDLARPPEVHPVRVWLAIAATLIYLLVLDVLGFFLATVLYSITLMYFGEFRKPLPTVILGAAIAGCFMFVFMRVVYVALPLGVPPFQYVSYALMVAMGVR